ncbi:hypothetical protein [Kribbella caucasensis]|nr:hypothetical protein [Kribbella sp. VKM Ac-2527]
MGLPQTLVLLSRDDDWGLITPRQQEFKGVAKTVTGLRCSK